MAYYHDYYILFVIRQRGFPLIKGVACFKAKNPKDAMDRTMAPYFRRDLERKIKTKYNHSNVQIESSVYEDRAKIGNFNESLIEDIFL